MGSRKEEERNEKIIRGLMKLPPNRRCINCNSLGPQYVCTNFWTFVCMTCSGIHREFPHRVKSVSMAKFTSQEVDALQNGGNQRAREIYLKDWDFQRQRLPDNSNVNKVRDFIKAVYVDKRYAGGKTSEKPPKDTQGLGSCEDMTRRASSYHSYSQSPPYDYQYEDRRYGKLGAALTRKPGSDRGHHIGKISSFVYSPGRMSEQMFEDRFANEGSGSRMSDYSVSSGSDPFRSGAQSPNFEKDAGFNSPPIQPSRDSLSSITNFKRDINGIPRPQRTTSLGSIGSFDSNSISLKSYHSGGLADVVSEPEQAAGAHRDKVSAIPQSYGPVNYGALDLFQAPIVPGPVSSPAPPIDLFNLPATSLAPVNTFQTPQASSSPSINSYQPSRSTTTLDRNPQELSNSKNEGWATFDTSSPAATIPVAESLSPVTAPGNGVSSVKFDQFPSSNTGTQWQAFQNSGAHSHGPALSSDPWFDSFHNVQAPAIATNTQSWNAFDKSTNHLPLDGVKQISEPQLAAYEPSSSADQSWNAFAVSTSHLPLDGVKQNCEPQSWNAFDAFTSHLPLDGDMQNNEPQLQNSEPQSGNAFDDSTSHFPLDGVKQNNEPKLQNSEPQSWNAFADSTSHLPLDGVKQNSEPELAAYEPPLTANQYLSSIISQDSNIDGNLRPASLHGPPGLPIPSHVDKGPSYTPSVLPVMGVMQAHATEHKSTNPFDFPYDSDLEQSNMFLDMSSLQAALPNAVQSWFPQNPAAPFIPAAAQGGLPYMSGQAPTAQLPNVPTQEPVASVGGNPFA